MAKPRKSRKLTHISRKIHAGKQGTRKKKQESWKALKQLFWVVIIGGFTTVLALNLYSTPLFNPAVREKQAVQKAEYEEVKGEITKYEELLFKYPGYRDAYIKLAILSWKIGQNEKAKEYLKSALGIDPNNETAIALSRDWGME